MRLLSEHAREGRQWLRSLHSRSRLHRGRRHCRLCAAIAELEQFEVISPYPAGSASDTVSSRGNGPGLAAYRTTMVIEARPGAGGSIGLRFGRKIRPGWLYASDQLVFDGNRERTAQDATVRSVRDFVPVVLIGTSPNMLVASAKSGFKTVADLVAAAKAKPDTLTFASAGIGSSSHMAAERFRLAANIDVRHVPFREGGLMQVMGGNIDFYFIPLAAAASALGSDKLVVAGGQLTDTRRALPNVPSVVELGYPDAVFRFWNGISAPAKTPRDIVNKLHDVGRNRSEGSCPPRKAGQAGG